MGLSSEKFYIVGEAENYHSIYGYPKRRFPVYEANADGTRASSYGAVASIKEEPLLDEDGKLWGRCFYTKSGILGGGKYRFYPSCEALIAAAGGKVLNKPAAEHPIKGQTGASIGDVTLTAVPENDPDALDEATSTQPTLEQRMAALEGKIEGLLTTRPQKKATSTRKPVAKKAARKSAKAPTRKKKVNY